MTTHFKGALDPRDYNMPPPPPPPTPPPRSLGSSSNSSNNSSNYNNNNNNNYNKSLSIAAKVFEPIAPAVKEIHTRQQQQQYSSSSFREEDVSGKRDVIHHHQHHHHHQQQRIVDMPLDAMNMMMSIEEKVAADAFVDVYDDQYLTSNSNEDEEDCFDDDDDDDASDVEHGCFDDSLPMYSTSDLSTSRTTISSQYVLY